MATDAPSKSNGEPAPAPEKLVKPPKPDEDAFKKALNQAEKEHKAVMVKFVCMHLHVPRQPPAGPAHGQFIVWFSISDPPLTAYRTPSRRRSTWPSRTVTRTRLIPPRSAARSSSPSSRRSARSRPASRTPAPPSSTRSSALMSRSSPASPSRKPPAARFPTSPSTSSTASARRSSVLSTQAPSRSSTRRSSWARFPL